VIESAAHALRSRMPNLAKFVLARVAWSEMVVETACLSPHASPLRRDLRLRNSRLRVPPPVGVETLPSKWVLVQHLRGQDSSHREFDPTVEDRIGSLYPESLPLTAPELSMSMRTFVGRVVRHHRAQHLAQFPAGTVRPASAQVVMIGSVVLRYGRQS